MGLMEYLTDENAKRIADDIIRHFEEKGTKDNVEFSYELHAGVMSSIDENTSFEFDPDQGSVCDEFKEILFSEEIEPEPGEETTEEHKYRIKAVNSFLELVCKKASEDHVDKIREKIRKVVIPDSDPRIFPLKEVRLSNFEVVDYSSMPDYSKYQLIIHKMAPASVQPPSVRDELFSIHEETGEPYDAIVKRKKEEQDPSYEYVSGVDTKKIYFEYSLAFYVDYAPIPREEFEQLIGT
jgi:hypothetical protein